MLELKPLNHIVFFRTSSIGDVVLASACIAIVQKLLPATKITFIGSKPSLALIHDNFPDIQAIEIKRDNNWTQLLETASKIQNVDLFVDLQYNARSLILGKYFSANFLKKFFKNSCTYVHIKKRSSERAKLVAEARIWGRRRVLKSSDILPPKRQYEVMLETLYRGLKLRGFDLEKHMDLLLKATTSLPLARKNNEQSLWFKELNQGEWIAVAPGAAYATKKAPFPILLGVLEDLKTKLSSQSKKIGLLLIGDENDRTIARKLTDDLNWSGPVLNLCGKLNLSEAASALSLASVTLAHDSSLAHISEAVGTPVGVLFGPTIERFGFAPFLEKSFSFSTLLGCRPCSKHGKIPCRFNDQLCFSSLSSKLVVNYLEAQLKT